MKITKRTLQKLIKEELKQVFSESLVDQIKNTPEYKKKFGSGYQHSSKSGYWEDAYKYERQRDDMQKMYAKIFNSKSGYVDPMDLQRTFGTSEPTYEQVKERFHELGFSFPPPKPPLKWDDEGYREHDWQSDMQSNFSKSLGTSYHRNKLLNYIYNTNKIGEKYYNMRELNAMAREDFGGRVPSIQDLIDLLIYKQSEGELRKSSLGFSNPKYKQDAGYEGDPRLRSKRSKKRYEQ